MLKWVVEGAPPPFLCGLGSPIVQLLLWRSSRPIIAVGEAVDAAAAVAQSEWTSSILNNSENL